MRKNKDGKVRGAPSGNTVPAVQPIRNAQPTVGRNEACPCRSGKKHKHCCGIRRGPVTRVSQVATGVTVSKFAVAASLRQQGIAAPDAYAFTKVGELGWTEARQQYEQMTEAEQAAFWDSCNAGTAADCYCDWEQVEGELRASNPDSDTAAA